MRGVGSHRASRRVIRSQVTVVRWLRRLSVVIQRRTTWWRKARSALVFRVVLVVPAQDASEPASMLWDGLMPASLDLAFQRSQLGWRPFRVGDPLELEPPRFPRLRANMREAEKPERVRLAESTRLAVASSEPPELDQPRLLSVQLQDELVARAALLPTLPL
jgi:hypothetical protein